MQYIRTSSTSTYKLTNWCHQRSCKVQPGVQYPVLPQPQRMTWLPHAGPEDHPSLLGCLVWTVHQGQYSPEGKLSLHPHKLLDIPLLTSEVHTRGWKRCNPKTEKQFTDLALMQISLTTSSGAPYAPSTRIPTGPAHAALRHPDGHGRRLQLTNSIIKAKCTSSCVIYSVKTLPFQSHVQISTFPIPKTPKS